MEPMTLVIPGAFVALGLVALGILIVVFLVLIFLEYRELKTYNEEFPFIADAIEEVAKVVNSNSDVQKKHADTTNDHAIAIAIMKATIGVHDKALNLRLVEDIKELQQSGD